MSDLADVHLNELTRTAEAVLEQIKSFFSTLSDAQLNWRPKEGIWSIAQCLDHVIVTDQHYFAGIKKAMEDSADKKAPNDKPYRVRWLGKFYMLFVKPGGVLKFKASKIFQPSSRTEGRVVLNDFEEHQHQMLALIKRAKGLDLAYIKLGWPLSRFIRISLGESFSMMVAHEQRHILQARRIYEMENFPKT